MTELILLARISMRNIFASFLNVIIGLIILAGTLFFVVGGSMIKSMDAAMSRSIIGSVAGNAQIYQGSSKDAPNIFDGWNPPDQDAIPDFSKVKAPLLQHPNIKMVVPMGIDTAIVAYGNTVDQALEKLRTASMGKPKAPKAQIDSLKSHVRQIIHVIQGDYAKLSLVVDKKTLDTQAVQDLAKASSDGFWNGFDAAPGDHLEFLENQIGRAHV